MTLWARGVFTLVSISRNVRREICFKKMCVAWCLWCVWCVCVCPFPGKNRKRSEQNNYQQVETSRESNNLKKMCCVCCAVYVCVSDVHECGTSADTTSMPCVRLTRAEKKQGHLGAHGRTLNYQLPKYAHLDSNTQADVDNGLHMLWKDKPFNRNKKEFTKLLNDQTLSHQRTNDILKGFNEQFNSHRPTMIRKKSNVSQTKLSTCTIRVTTSVLFMIYNIMQLPQFHVKLVLCLNCLFSCIIVRSHVPTAVYSIPPKEDIRNCQNVQTSCSVRRTTTFYLP